MGPNKPAIKGKHLFSNWRVSYTNVQWAQGKRRNSHQGKAASNEKQEKTELIQRGEKAGI